MLRREILKPHDRNVSFVLILILVLFVVIISALQSFVLFFNFKGLLLLPTYQHKMHVRLRYLC